MELITLPLPYGCDSLARFAQLKPLGNSVLLDSGEGYLDHIDVMTAEPAQIVCLREPKALTDTVEIIRKHLREHKVAPGALPVSPGWFGVWSYTLGQALESLQGQHTDLPLLWMGFYPALIVTDHAAQASYLQYLSGYQQTAEKLKAAFLAEGEEDDKFVLSGRFTGNLDSQEYLATFNKVQDYIHCGDCYQINLSREYSAPYTGSIWQAYRKLRASQSAPMGAFVETADWSLLSLSPERFIRSADAAVETKPIKGTRARSCDPDLDLALAQELRSSPKDRAENLMIVDLLRNDLGKSCETGSIKVDKLFEVESFSNVHHLVSTVSGRIKTGMDALDVLLGAFPGGSITGAPKRRAMEIIDELEPHSRGFYCGSLVTLDVCGRMDSNILIRSLVAKDGMIRCWGGGGIVADSTCVSEYQEINDKIGKLLTSL